MIHIHRKTEQHDFFFSNEDLGSAQKLYIGLSDVNFNEGEPRQREVSIIYSKSQAVSHSYSQNYIRIFINNE